MNVWFIPRWFPFKRAITVWWPFLREPTVYLPLSYRDRTLRIERALFHEEAHWWQWQELGRIRFLWAYLHQDRRMELEAEAFAASCNWWYERGWSELERAGKMVRVLDHYAEQLAEHYRLDKTVSECRAAIKRWL